MLYFHSFNIFCCTELTKVYIYKHLLWRKCSLPGDFLLRVGVITFFFKLNYSTLSEKWWAKTITKFEYCHRSYRVWTSTCSHSGQTDVLCRGSATLPVATYPVSCFPQSVVMHVIPLSKAVWAQPRDHALWIFWDWIKGDSTCLRKTLNVSRKKNLQAYDGTKNLCTSVKKRLKV